jgi:hypothetical protein
VLVMTEALPWWPKIKSRPKQRKAGAVRPRGIPREAAKVEILA